MKHLLAALLLSGLAACGTTEDEPVGYPEGLGTPENPIPQDNVSYSVRSRIDASLDASAPEVTSVAASLRAFSQNPAHALIGLAQSANVAELTQLYSALPSTLTSKLEGWINGEIDKARVAGKTVRQYATDLTGFADTALTEFGLDSTLSFTPAKALHTITAISFRLAGFDVVVPLGGLEADTINQQPVVTIAEAGAITFGEHHFGLAFGDHAWHAMNLASAAAVGDEIHTTLAKTVNCRAVAQAVATKCVLGVCVAHESQLTAVCERGLDLLVAELSTRVLAFDFDVLRYTAGTGRLIDDNHDGLANRIEHGVWDSEMNLGPASATFTAFAAGR